jgi:hypothetical protein
MDWEEPRTTLNEQPPKLGARHKSNKIKLIYFHVACATHTPLLESRPTDLNDANDPKDSNDTNLTNCLSSSRERREVPVSKQSDRR